jgi:multidrug efflux system membrane fusion protein
LIQLKGTFANQDNTLWPGQFVQVALTLSEISNAIVVPTQAVQTGQNGQFVFVVKPDRTVETRTVTLGDAYQGETVISRGLKGGETVVTDGQLRLTPGAKVSVKSADAAGLTPETAEASP